MDHSVKFTIFTSNTYIVTFKMLFVEIIVKTINVYIYFHISINKNLKPFDQHRHRTRE